MAVTESLDRLGCGTAIDEIWESIDQPPNEHQAGCPQCQAARASLQQLVEMTQDLRSQDVEAPSERPSDRVKLAVMRVAKAEVRRGRRLTVVEDSDGGIEISEQTLAAVVRFACDTVPGVHARRCQVMLDSTGATSRAVAVMVRVALHSQIDMGSTTAQVRTRVRAVLSAQAGLQAERVDVLVEDLYDV